MQVVRWVRACEGLDPWAWGRLLRRRGKILRAQQASSTLTASAEEGGRVSFLRCCERRAAKLTWADLDRLRERPLTSTSAGSSPTHSSSPSALATLRRERCLVPPAAFFARLTPPEVETASALYSSSSSLSASGKSSSSSKVPLSEGEEGCES